MKNPVLEFPRDLKSEESLNTRAQVKRIILDFMTEIS